MSGKVVVYRGVGLMPGSAALDLYNATKSSNPTTAKAAVKALDAHMKQLDVNQAELLKRYDKN